MAKCTYEKCNSGLPGRWQPVVLLWPEGYKPMQCQPISVDLKHHCLCDDCQKIAKANVLIPPEGFRQIIRAVVGHGKMKPSMKTARVTCFIPETHKQNLAGAIYEPGH